jgi:3-oxoacyl-[acyl-carrier-protein] synthase-1
MAEVYILDYEILSTYGDLQQSIEGIKDRYTNMQTKEFRLASNDIKIPFFAFKEHVEQEQKAIYKAIKSVASKLLNKLDAQMRKSTAVILGTSQIDWNLVDAINASAYEYKKQPYSSKKLSIDTYAKELGKEFGLHEFSMSINTACTSSANAILEASNLIKCGVVDNVLVLGVEIFSPIMSSGFETMELLSKTKIKPFDKDRDGLILGEGIGAMLLSNKACKWSVEGGFSNCNSATITSVSSSGEECVEVMQKALLSAKVDAQNITAIKAHATGSISNDLAEINAIKNVFKNDITFSALKPYVGHTIGASGVLEVALFMGSVDAGFIPKTLNCDESILEDYTPTLEHKACKSGTFMCNYFGFGGNNISLIIKKS